MKTLQIVVHNITKAEEVARHHNVKFEALMLGEIFSTLANISGTTNELIDFVNEFFMGSKVHPYYVNEILELI